MITACFAQGSTFGKSCRLYVFALLLCTCTSCSVIRVVELEGATWTCAGSGQHYCNRDTVITSIWKGKNAKSRKTDCQHGISRFKVTTKPADVLLGFLSAGFYVRQRIEWDCSQRRGSSSIED